MISQDRESSRGVFVQVWEKYRNGEQLEPLQQLVLTVILEHPEYHAGLEDPDVRFRDYAPESGRENPFMHMGMHIAIREQVSTDRPPGISAIYQNLSDRFQDEHRLQHRMMECLGESLWQAQQSGGMPDDADYLECLRKLR
ncbi:MAG: DUF1841 family protein [Gammaproteobacteria bacterium]